MRCSFTCEEWSQGCNQRERVTMFPPFLSVIAAGNWGCHLFSISQICRSSFSLPRQRIENVYKFQVEIFVNLFYLETVSKAVSKGGSMFLKCNVLCSPRGRQNKKLFCPQHLQPITATTLSSFLLHSQHPRFIPSCVPIHGHSLSILRSIVTPAR